MSVRRARWLRPSVAGVNGRDALEVDEAFLVVLVLDDLELRVVDDDALAAGLGLAVDDHALPGGEDFLDVLGVEPAERQQRGMSAWRSASWSMASNIWRRPPSRLAAVETTIPQTQTGVSVGGVGEMLEVAAVLVAAGVMGEEVADGGQPEAFEGLEPRGAEAGHVRERLRKAARGGAVGPSRERTRKPGRLPGRSVGPDISRRGAACRPRAWLHDAVCPPPMKRLCSCC